MRAFQGMCSSYSGVPLSEANRRRKSAWCKLARQVQPVDQACTTGASLWYWCFFCDQKSSASAASNADWTDVRVELLGFFRTWTSWRTLNVVRRGGGPCKSSDQRCDANRDIEMLRVRAWFNIRDSSTLQVRIVCVFSFSLQTFPFL